jgi:hypothetical protein
MDPGLSILAYGSRLLDPGFSIPAYGSWRPGFSTLTYGSISRLLNPPRLWILAFQSPLMDPGFLIPRLWILASQSPSLAYRHDVMCGAVSLTILLHHPNCFKLATVRSLPGWSGKSCAMRIRSSRSVMAPPSSTGVRSVTLTLAPSGTTSTRVLVSLTWLESSPHARVLCCRVNEHSISFWRLDRPETRSFPS